MSIRHTSIPLLSAKSLVRTPPSVLAWFELHISLLEEVIRELEARLHSNSSNCNQPSSLASPFDKKPPKPTAKKARKKRHGIRQQMLEPTQVKHSFPKPCSCECLEGGDIAKYYRQQYIETPQPRVDVTHFVQHGGRCTRDGKSLRAYNIPHEFRFAFGPHLHALVTELVGVHGASRERVKSLLASVYGLHNSQRAIQKCLNRATEALFSHYEAIKAAAHSTEINHIDGTAWRRFGPASDALLWLWGHSFATGNALCNYRQPQQRGICLAYSGLARSFGCCGYSVYKQWGGPARQTCLAHLIRGTQR